MSSRFRLISVLAAFYLVASLVLRALLWRTFGPEASVTFKDFTWSLLYGGFSDVYQLVYLSFPFVILLAAVSNNVLHSKTFHWFVAAGSYAVVFLILYISAAEYFFFEEFDSRFNLVAVDYLIYPTEVFVNLWESYPIVRYVIIAAIASAVILKVLWRWIGPGLGEKSRSPLSRRALIVCAHAVVVAALAFGVTSDRFEFSANRVAVEIGNNGINSLFRAFRTHELSYQLYYRTLPEQDALKLVKEDLASRPGRFTDNSSGNLERAYEGRPDAKKLNVVVMCLESQGANYVGAYGDDRGLTPEFDRLSKEGLFFKNVYASGTRTVRGLEAVSTSFPPIPSESILKRPNNEGVANWGEVMKRQGYQVSFLYGGYGYFDNMNYFFGYNGFAISDRTDIPNPIFGNIWGVSDQDLYGHALSYFDQQAASGQPFFSLIMSTSNHKPYTFPPGVPGIPEKGGRTTGVKYADWAVGQFIEQAKSRPWFDNTLFVIVADHDARVYGKAEIPIRRYRIPLLFLSPKNLPPSTVEKVVSQLDIAPTALDFLGLPYEAPFFGTSALREPERDNTVFLSHNHEVAMMRDGKVAILGLQKSVKSYRYDFSKPDSLDAVPLDSSFTDLATAYFQTASSLFQGGEYKIRN